MKAPPGKTSGQNAKSEEGDMADQEARIQDKAEPSEEEVQRELEKKPGESLEPTLAGAEAANKRLEETIEQASDMGTDKDALGMETEIIDKIAGH
jgi:hypothetical protein